MAQMPTGKQLTAILMYMRFRGAITPATAYLYADSLRLSERIRELEALGWRIKRERVRTSRGAMVQSYRLED